MPSVKKGESQEDFASRCIPYLIKNEGKDQKQAAGECYGIYKQHKQESVVAKGLAAGLNRLQIKELLIESDKFLETPGGEDQTKNDPDFDYSDPDTMEEPDTIREANNAVYKDISMIIKGFKGLESKINNPELKNKIHSLLGQIEEVYAQL